MNIDLETMVWHRANHCCEYCRIPQAVEVVPYQIDHVIAKKHRGTTTQDNLALACFNCNNYKGPNIATLDQTTQELTRLFHPRQDVWKDHFMMTREGEIVGKTPIGQATIFILKMNEPISVMLRQLLIRAGTMQHGV